MSDEKKEKNGFMSEFKAFLLRGNVIDLAVGIIIGGAFQAIVRSLVDDLIMPVLGLLLGKLDFNDRVIVLNDEQTLTFNYGSFITNVINFLIMGFIIFLLIKGINKLRDIRANKQAGAPEEPTAKECPYCRCEVNIAATRCPHCTSELKQ